MPKLPTDAQRLWFEGEIKGFPLGAKVRGNSAMQTHLAKAKGRRDRDMAMVGEVVDYDRLQLRILVRWPHPLYADMKAEDVPAEPLSPMFLEVANG